MQTILSLFRCAVQIRIRFHHDFIRTALLLLQTHQTTKRKQDSRVGKRSRMGPAHHRLYVGEQPSPLSHHSQGRKLECGHYFRIGLKLSQQGHLPQE